VHVSVAIEIRKPDGRWIELAEGIRNSRELIESWIGMAREIYPMAEVRVLNANPIPPATRRTH